MTSIEQVALAVLAHLNDDDGELHPYPALDIDDAKGKTTPHVQLTVAERYVPAERGGYDSRRAYRVTTRPLAGSVTNARELERGCDVALRGAILTIDDKQTTPFKRETGDPVGEDEDHYYSGLTYWTFVL